MNPPRAGTSPHDIRAALFPEDQAGLDADYTRALADARDEPLSVTRATAGI